LLNTRRKFATIFSPRDYELLVFDSLRDLYKELIKREKKYNLCRLIAGYSWFWKSDPKRKPNPSPDAIDIKIEGLEFQWNQTDKDWINNPKDKYNPLKEIGCIHTTQGYDLNFAGVIFGEEISFNTATNEIEIDPKKYFDKNGKNGIRDSKDLKAYIINIYKTIMYRGIRGTFIYACNKDLSTYLKQHISVYKTEIPLRILHFDEVKPYVNSVPLVDILAAAGNFSDLQIHSNFQWIELPFNISVKNGYFVCKIVGESMNKVIPNGSYCLFKQDEGGSRNGKIVLVQSTNINDSEFGSGYTVKEYHSRKSTTGDQWSHDSIVLKPLSYDPKYNNITLSSDDLETFKVIGVFEKIIFF
jgi:uncharacterized protein